MLLLVALSVASASARPLFDSPWNPFPVRGGAPLQHLVTAHGAVGDNATMNTAPINAAFDACARSGGGYVVVPGPGVFLTGQVRLRSGCYLLLQPGAALQATTDDAIGEYGADSDFWALVVGVGVANTGVIAPALPRGSAPGAAGGELVGTMWQSIASYDSATNSFTKQPPGSDIGLLLVQDGANLTVAGVTLRDSGFWAQTFRRCAHVREERVHVEGSVQWGTADGADVESGFNLTFADSVFKTGDDCLAFRSGSFEQLHVPWPAGPVAPVQRVRLSNLTLTSSSSAIKLEASTVSNRTDVGDIFDVLIDGVTIIDSNRGIGIWQRSGERRNSPASAGRGAIRDVLIRNVVIRTRFDSKPQFWGSGEPFVLTVAPRNGDCCVGVQNVTLENVVAEAENSALVSSLGSPLGGSPLPPPVRGVRLVNVSITIGRFGNATRPQRDYRPVSAGMPGVGEGGTVPALVDGVVVENIEDLVIGGGGGVTFSSAPRAHPPYWGMACINASGPSPVHFADRAHWLCRNVSAAWRR